MEHLPPGSPLPDPHDDIFWRAEEENRLRYRAGDTSTGAPIEVGYPLTEQEMHDADVQDIYGPPDERL